jgi:uncharacterized membrane protein (UPF0182 family)
MVAKSGDVAGDYGQLVVFRMPSGINVVGPAQIDSVIKQNTAVSTSISLLNTQGSEADFGNVLGIPIGNSLLYLRPLYVKSTTSNNPLPQLKKVIVVYGNQVAYADTLQGALSQLFPGLPNLTQEQAPTTPTTPGGTTGPPVTTPPGTATTAQGLLQQAQAAFVAADNALKAGDLATYQKQIKAAQTLTDQALSLLSKATTPPGTATTTPGAPTSTTSSSVPTASTSPPSSA